MTYDAALNIFMVIAIPAVILFGFRLFSIYRQSTISQDERNPLAYTVDPGSGEIIFTDERPALDPGQNGNISGQELEIGEASMLDVLVHGKDSASSHLVEIEHREEQEETEGQV